MWVHSTAQPRVTRLVTRLFYFSIFYKSLQDNTLRLLIIPSAHQSVNLKAFCRELAYFLQKQIVLSPYAIRVYVNGAAPAAVSPYVARVYVNSSEQIVCQ